MTDILYVCGKGGGDLLRLSLRSLAAHAKGVGRIVVAGYCPDWLSDEVVRVPVEDLTLGGYKHINIMNCIFKAIESGAVRGDFLYSSVDHFLAADADLSKWPFYVRPGVLLTYEEATRRAHGTPSEYNASLAATKKVLEAAGLDIRLYCNHANTWMNADDADEVKRLIESADRYDSDNHGFEPTCMFMAVRNRRAPVEVVVRDDVKLYDLDESRMGFAYSIGDWEDCTNELQNFVRGSFAEPCIYERGGSAAVKAPVRKTRQRRKKS